VIVASMAVAVVASLVKVRSDRRRETDRTL
jgi:hypothetical protein